MWFDGFLRCRPFVRSVRYRVFSPSVVLCLAIGLCIGGSARGAWAQQPVIQHARLDCLPNDQYPLLSAVIEPGDEIRTCKVYFRSSQYPDFYYVEMDAMESEADSFQAVLPMPSEETAEVFYYLECVDQSFNGVRTEEYRSQVTASADCRRRHPAAAWFTGGNPGVFVGATRIGMAAIPPGFKAAGIVGFVSAAGVTSGVGGGIGAGTIAAVGAGAAAAAAGAVVATSGNEDTPTPAAPAAEAPPEAAVAATPSAPPASPTTPSASNEPPRACFNVEPNPPTIQPGESVRLDASCSTANESGQGTDAIAKYEWDLGDGREREGRVITPVYREAGVFTVTLTVTDSGGSGLNVGYGRTQKEDAKSDKKSIEIKVEKQTEKPESAEPVIACFTVLPTSMCALQVDASCSTGPISSYDWVLDYYNVFQTKTASGMVVNTDWYPSCAAATPIKIQLTVHGPGATTDFRDQMVTLIYSRASQKASQVSTSFASFLETPSAQGSPGQVVLNGGRLDVTQSGAQVRHQFYGRRGENTVAARTGVRSGKGLWRFDFRGSENFVPGSLKVKSGHVVSVDAHSVTFRINEPGERMEFGFELTSGRR